MNNEQNFKKYLKQKVFLYLMFIIMVSIFTVIYSLLIYFNKVNTSVESVNIWSFVIGVLAFFILGLMSGKVASKNGLLEGLVAGLFIILVALLINLVLSIPFVGNNFVKMATYITASCIGGIIGVNLKKH